MLRLAMREDLPYIQQLAEQVFSQFGDYRRILTQFFHSPAVKTFLWDVAGKAAGLAMVERIWNPKTKSYYVDLLAIAVEPSWQDRGVGGQLLSAVIEWVRQQGSTHMFLSVAETNAGAQRFFRRYGFLRVAENDGYYPAGQQAHLMAKELD
ncbi:MAG: GNAT family N-acetyltransferase [Acidobacteria bacterium]|nr:GNAT family N-acetyltransferase [Acidobacteriota bacterium]MBI3656284.1 GNAT family N-acetyltransferase [Acidobacteriota bacterium]